MFITIDLDDFSFQNNMFFWLNKLREQFPSIKFSMFFVPADAQYSGKMRPDEEKVIKDQIKKAVLDGWIELIPHGITHMDREFEKADYQTMELTLKAYEEFFKDWGVPYVKGFKAPQWLISKEAIKCLDAHGWWLAIDANQENCDKAKKNYTYNWDIANPFPKGQETVYAHGHMSPPSVNHLAGCIHNLIKIPPNAEFHFVSEVMND